MTVAQLRAALAADPNAPLHWMLPDGDFVPAHFHVTEVGRIQKDFIDCGGTTRSVTSCQIQLWVAADTDHRLTAGTFAAILKLAESILKSDELPVEVEYEGVTISQFPLGGVERTPSGLLFHLGTKHTDCLAPDRCKVPGTAGTGCC